MVHPGIQSYQGIVLLYEEYLQNKQILSAKVKAIPTKMAGNVIKKVYVKIHCDCCMNVFGESSQDICILFTVYLNI